MKMNNVCGHFLMKIELMRIASYWDGSISLFVEKNKKLSFFCEPFMLIF